MVDPNTPLLLNIEKDFKHLKSWFDGLDFSLTLLFRGSEQDFSFNSFTRFVGNKGPTLHVVKSENDYIFGGCAFETYPTGGNTNKRDDKAFLF